MVSKSWESIATHEGSDGQSDSRTVGQSCINRGERARHILNLYRTW